MPTCIIHPEVTLSREDVQSAMDAGALTIHGRDTLSILFGLRGRTEGTPFEVECYFCRMIMDDLAEECTYCGYPLLGARSEEFGGVAPPYHANRRRMRADVRRILEWKEVSLIASDQPFGKV